MAIKWNYTYEEAKELESDDKMRLITLCRKASSVAGCGMPQFIPEGAGARFLLETISEGMDISDTSLEDAGFSYIEDYISEVADGLVPIYYNELWHDWLALKGYQYDNDIFGDELPRGRDDLDKIPQQDLYDIAYKILGDITTYPESWGGDGKGNWSGELLVGALWTQRNRGGKW